MDKESLNEAIIICVNGIYNSNINMIDKIELMLNLDKFLSTDTYQENIEVLQEKEEKKKVLKKTKL